MEKERLEGLERLGLALECGKMRKMTVSGVREVRVRVRNRVREG